MTAYISVLLLVFGAILGSFAGAQVWRLRARQLKEDHDRWASLSRIKRPSSNERAERDELAETSSERNGELKKLAPLLSETASSDRSRCLHCQHQLAWHDLLPVISWISSSGRCRYCKKTIGWFELLIEGGMGLFFVLSYVLWPLSLDSMLGVAAFIVWLGASVPLVVLFAYDAKWFLLPDLPMAIFIGLSAVFAGLIMTLTGVTTEALWSVFGAMMAIGGLYWLLHAVSGGAWVGYGDATLGVGLGLLLGDWMLAVLAVILANGLGTLLVLPAILTGKLDRRAQIPFGPLLMAGAVIAFFVGREIIDWYLHLL